MHLLNTQRSEFSGVAKGRASAGFTLAEVLMAAVLMAIFVTVCVSAVMTSQICTRKSKEDALSMNFLTKYGEYIKALPFTSIGAGMPINYAYNGVGGLPLITIPANNTWISVSNTTYQTFYPDLLWFNNRNPMMKVVLTQNSVAGVVHDIEINVKLDWDAPLSKGGRLESQVDILRTVNVPTL